MQIALAEIAAEGRVIRDIHDVRVRETDEGEIVNFHCRVDPSLIVRRFIRLDEAGKRVAPSFPGIERVIGHAEPRRVISCAPIVPSRSV